VQLLDADERQIVDLARKDMLEAVDHVNAAVADLSRAISERAAALGAMRFSRMWAAGDEPGRTLTKGARRPTRTSPRSSDPAANPTEGRDRCGRRSALRFRSPVRSAQLGVHVAGLAESSP
jgi:hypothetical protein